MKSEDERKWFEFHEIQPELAELYRYFDRTVLCYRIIIAVLLGIISIMFRNGRAHWKNCYLSAKK